MEAKLTKSDDKKKKYKVVVKSANKTKTIHFGQAGAEDYTIHHDIERKKAYQKRHKKNEDWANAFTAGFWSKQLLWNQPTLAKSKKKIADDFNIVFK